MCSSLSTKSLVKRLRVTRALVADQRMVVVDRDLLLRALEVYEVHRIDFADAYLVASAETTGTGAVVSFDRAISRVGTIERIEP